MITFFNSFIHFFGGFMTAEVAIMNKTAVALAADSAVSSETQGGIKIYNTVNKLFALSKYHPVGIMVYGNYEFMGVPWETIIKLFRVELGRTKFDSLQEYGACFYKFIENNISLFPDSLQASFFAHSVFSLYRFIRDEIFTEIESYVDNHGPINDEDVVITIAKNIISMHYQKWKNSNFLPHIPDILHREIIVKHKKELRKAKDLLFQKLPLSPYSIKQLYKIAGFIFVKEIFRKHSSGIVIAGFGVKDIFPSVYAYLYEGVFLNIIKYKQNLSSSIDYDKSASIIPFAQREMVDAFMEGINPDYKEEINSYFLEAFINRYPEMIKEKFGHLCEDSIDEVNKNLLEFGNKLLNEYDAKMSEYRRDKYVDPIMYAVSILPKDELAAMAESLVNLTSFKRRMSTDAETVGGPIDVAVISKGDGFIWIKRKHYFKQELNPQFTANYYRDNSTQKGDDNEKEQTEN